MDIYFQQTAQPMVIYFTGGFNFNSYVVGGGGVVADGNYGDITVNGAGSNWIINTGVVESGNLAARNVTFDKLPEIGAYKFLGRHNGTVGDIQEIGIDGGLEFHGGNLRRSALTGVVTASAGSNITTLATGVVSSVNLGGDITQAGLNLITGLNSIVQREFLGLGSAAIANTGDFAAFIHTHPVSGLEQSGATTGQILQWDGMQWAPTTNSSGSSINFQAWHTAGTYTWTNPSPSVRKLGRARLVGGSGGGGSGRKGAAGTVRCGGGASSGACVYEFWFWTDQFPASVTVVVGAGGAGGASVSTNDTSGNAGAPGGATTFYAIGFPIGFFAPAGGPGGGGTNAAGTAGSVTSSGCLLLSVGTTNLAGGAASGTGGTGGSGANSNLIIPTGGGAGGGITSLDVASSGGAGGVFGNGTIGTGVSSAQGFPGGPGVNGLPSAPRGPIGQGGGGGGGSTTGNAGNGANGGAGGGGAGGGGAATNGVGNSGAGGTGGDGFAEIIVFL